MRDAVRVMGVGAAVSLAVLAALAASLGEELRYIVWDQLGWVTMALVPVGAVVLRAYLNPRPATLRYSRASSLARIGSGTLARLADLPDALRLAAALLLVAALARPQSSRLTDRIEHEGIDIALVLDMSDSMESPDLAPNRLEAAKIVIDDFVRRRPHDRIGLVVYGSSASTVSPLTMDHDVLRRLVARLRIGVLDGSSTAIGAGLGVALNRLEQSTSDTKIIVLLTDGVHNAGGIDPDRVAQEAADRGIGIYTVLLGQHQGGVRGGVDPAQLERLASVTGGYAYTATDIKALTVTFQDLLNKLERSVIDGNRVRAELFHWFLWASLGLLMLDTVLRTTRLRRFP
ncbi:MAG: VWA domain-containing protein [Nannocystaceae bacterium]